MILMPDLFSFAYVPNWYSQLDMLAEMALPEPWRFKNPIYLTKIQILRFWSDIFTRSLRNSLIDYKDERNPSSAADYFHIENEFCCFHTGLYTRRYKAIYACFDRNKKKKDSMLEWYFRGFADELSPMLRHISPLPKKPSYYMTQYGVNYNPEWPIRVNVDHILGDEENLSRIPAEIREAQNLPLLLETAVELARRKAVVEPSIVVPQGVSGPGTILAADLPDRYGAARPCHDPHDHGRVLLGEYLPHLRDGVPQRAASFQGTGGALAHGHCGGIAAHRSQARSPAAGSALAERSDRFAPKQEGG